MAGDNDRLGPVVDRRSGARLRLLCASCLLLLVELFLIRWLGSNVLYLSYFSNFVLLGSFLGIGIGFLRARRRLQLFPFPSVATSRDSCRNCVPSRASRSSACPA